MKNLRWAMDGSFWDLDMSTPATLDGLARPVPSDTLPLGLTRGVRLSRPKQIDFFQRFMAMPFVPSYVSNDSARGGHGSSLRRVLTLPLGEHWKLKVGLLDADVYAKSHKAGTGARANSKAVA
ncbi:protein TRIGALACTOSYLDIACYLGLYCEROL 4, chloroplastic-like [Cornus florida]|uniref:protein TRIGALACTOSYLDIACYLGLYCEROL 4, chloroplastic-like n=1 Tax=Cornus florida TaxID=4283 RepID=UPI00289D3AB7|nr:protein TRIGALACTOSYLDIACYLGLYCEROL 4, chloroplastic-like [Cornus florida]